MSDYVCVIVEQLLHSALNCPSWPSHTVSNNAQDLVLLICHFEITEDTVK